MAFNSWQKKPDVEHEVNLTPLIDVSLVLVVMLLLMSPLAFESSINVRSSDKAAQAAEIEDQDEKVEIVVLPENRVRVNRDEMMMAEMEAVLRPLLAESKQRQVIIACEGDVTHGAFVGAMDVAKVCGATDIGVVERRSQ